MKPIDTQVNEDADARAYGRRTVGPYHQAKKGVPMRKCMSCVSSALLAFTVVSSDIGAAAAGPIPGQRVGLQGARIE